MSWCFILEFRFSFRGMTIFVSIIGQQIKISGQDMGREQIKLHLYGKELMLTDGQEVIAPLK